MAKYGGNNTTTGQAFRAKAVQTLATALPMPVVMKEDLGKKENAINQEHLSGKQAGAMVAVVMNGTLEVPTKLSIAVARGSKPTDIWDIMTVEADDIVVA